MNKKPNKSRKSRMPGKNLSATASRGATPLQYALFKTPLFPAVVHQRGQLYYEPGLAVTCLATGAASNSYFFIANGMYDPNITGTGHQPMGFDQMMSLYEQACVVRSKITVTFNPTWNMRVAVFLNPDTTVITSALQLMENGYCTTKSVTGNATQILQNMPSLTLSCDVAKYFGRRSSREMQDDNQLQTTAASNPTEGVYFGITSWFGHDNPGSNKEVYFDVLIEYDAIYWEPKKESVSVASKSEAKDPSVTLTKDGFLRVKKK
jgi:hypothetical protein